MFVSTLGIGLMQFLWVYNAMHINEKQFEQNVYAALKNIILKLDKQSYAVKINGESIDINDNFNSTIHNPDTNRQITIIPLNGLDSSIQNEISDLQNTIDIVENNEVDIQKTINNLEEVYNQIKVEIQHDDNPLERISLQSIDSIIYKELLSTGIVTDYEFAIVKGNELPNTGFSTDYGLAIINRNEDIIFKSDGYSNVNINSRYRANLFPTDIKEKEFYLVLDVPIRDKYGFNRSFYRILIFSISSRVLFAELLVSCFNVLIATFKVAIGVFSSWVILLIKSFLISASFFCLKMVLAVRKNITITISVTIIENIRIL